MLIVESTDLTPKLAKCAWNLATARAPRLEPHRSTDSYLGLEDKPQAEVGVCKTVADVLNVYFTIINSYSACSLLNLFELVIFNVLIDSTEKDGKDNENSSHGRPDSDV